MNGSGSFHACAVCNRQVSRDFSHGCVKNTVANAASKIPMTLASAAEGNFVASLFAFPRTHNTAPAKSGFRTFIAAKIPIVLNPVDDLDIKTPSVIPNPDTIAEASALAMVLNPEYDAKSGGSLNAGSKSRTGRSHAGTLNFFLPS